MMPDEQGILSKSQYFANRISSSAKKNENVVVVGHHDADGVCGASLLADYVFRLGGHCEIKFISEPNVRFLEKLASGKFDMVLFVDVGSGLSSEISRILGDRWLVIDHHEIPEEEMESDHILNPWQFAYDGGTDVSASGLCYFVCEKNRSSRASFVAISGGLADMQDTGPRRSLVGLNAKILSEDSRIESKVDILLFGRETRPAHESLASSIECYIPGLTSNKDACLASMRGAGVDLKLSSRWKTIADFTDEEKHQLLTAIVPHLAGTTNTVEDLVGTVYTTSSEDEFSPMRDARDFATILTCCGRMGKPALGFSLCVGDGGPIQTECDKVLADYRVELVKAVQTLTSSADRVLEGRGYSLVVADGIVSERMTGAVCQVLASLNRSKTKAVFLRTTTQEGDVKVSARLGKEAGERDLGRMLREIGRSTSGVGGGHRNRAGVRFSIIKQQEFQAAVDSQFQTKK